MMRNNKIWFCSSVRRVFLFSMFSLVLVPSVFSQAKKIEELSVSIEEAIEKQDYNELLKGVSSLYDCDTVLPDVSAYYLGYVLLKSDQLTASKTAFLRYVDLTKEQGKYIDSVVFFLNKIDHDLEQYGHDNCGVCDVLGPLKELDTCKVCLGHGITEQDCQRCSGRGNEVCPVCRGSGFETQQTQFYVNYVTCRTCQGAGQVECSRCQGDKTEKSACENCTGKGLKNKERICHHRDYDIPENNTKQNDNCFSR